MKFKEPREVEQIAYEMKLADYVRGLDRARINDLANGVPPYTQLEVEQNGIVVNVNDLTLTRTAHDARMQFYQNFLKPGRFLTATTDMGTKHKRTDRSTVVTKELARIMKRSLNYFETFRSKFALTTLHGIGPSGWDTSDFWCPDGLGVEDVLIPANTRLTMKNLPFFFKYVSYTAPELIRLTRRTAADPGWNKKMVDSCINWVDQESLTLYGNNWPDVWSPEKQAERVKGDGGFYAGDQVPTVDCFDFYFWDDSGKEEGWCRRIILDSWSTPQVDGGKWSMADNGDFGKNQFLYTSKNRKVASKWQELIAFQFGDLSAVAPFRYHSVRGLGYLLYSVCQLQNRLRCKFNESVFESLLMYFRVKNLDDVERALKVELANRGFIDESLQFIPASERFQVNAQLVELGLQDNSRLIGENASSWTQQPRSNDRTEKTKFQVMAEVQSSLSMVSAAMNQAYAYQARGEYPEIFRRFCNKDSRDPDIIEFRSRCMRQGVPESMLIPEAWNLEPERVMGAGNKTMEMAIAEQLMQYRNLYDPEPQRQILRDVTLAITDDPGKTEMLVPNEPQLVNDSVQLAQLAAGSLLAGLPVATKTGINHIDYVNTLMVDLALVIGRAQKRGGMATQEEIEGFQNIAQHIVQHMQVVAQDVNEKQRITEWQKELAKLMNLVKAFQQRLAEQQQQQASQNGGDPETAAKIKAMLITAEAKASNTRESHAQRTAQRQLQFEQKMKEDQQQHALDMQKDLQTHRLQIEADRVAAAIEIKKKRMSTTEE